MCDGAMRKRHQYVLDDTDLGFYDPKQGLVFAPCPLRSDTRFTTEMMALYSDWKRGFMPYPPLAMPKIMREVLELIESVHRAYELEKSERKERMNAERHA